MFFVIHFLMGGLILLLSFFSENIMIRKMLILVVLFFFASALSKHYSLIKDIPTREFHVNNFKLLFGTFLAAAITWYVNHEMGLGPIIANGLIGLIASLIFPKNAGSYYVSSFIGMSSQAVMPSLFASGIAGIISGLVIIFSKEVYRGIGGKGGTVAAISTQFARMIMSLFN